MSAPERDYEDPFEQTARCRYLLYSRDSEGDLEITPVGTHDASDQAAQRVLLVERRGQQLVTSGPAPISIEITTRLEAIDTTESG